jgi:HK97 family phage portal protein
MGILATFRVGLASMLGERKAHDLSGSMFAQDPWWWMSAGAVNTTGIGDGGANSAVFACIRVKAHGYAEAPARQFVREEQQWNEVPATPVEALLRKPNPYMTSHHLGGYIIYSTEVAGTAYFWKRRSAAGLVVELWPLRPDLVTPLSGGELSEAQRAEINAGQPAGYDDVESGSFIAGFRYTPGGEEFIIAPSEMIRLYDMPDPNDPRLGAAPIKTVLREILADEEAGQFATSLVKNMGVPGVIMTPTNPDDDGPDVEEADEMATNFRDKFGGDNRGKPLIVSGGPMKVSVVSFSPEQMDFKTVRRIPEERISAVTGVPAIVANLGAGLDRSTFANYAEAREYMTEDAISPLWEGFGVQWTEGLREDFGLSDNEAIRYDTSEVAALQDDKNEAAKRIDLGIKGGWAMVSEGRSEAGLEVDPSHEVFLRPANVKVVPAGETGEAEDVPPELDPFASSDDDDDGEDDGSSNGQGDDDKARKAAARKAVPTLTALLERHDRLVIAGVSGAGKSTLAGRIDDRQVVHTDDYIDAGWDEAPKLAAAAVKGVKRFVIEGMRALAATRYGADVDAVVWLPVSLRKLSDIEDGFSRGRQATFDKWLAAAGDDGPAVYVVEDVTKLALEGNGAVDDDTAARALADA